jgi:hypothetical protein
MANLQRKTIHVLPGLSISAIGYGNERGSQAEQVRQKPSLIGGIRNFNNLNHNGASENARPPEQII